MKELLFSCFAFLIAFHPGLSQRFSEKGMPPMKSYAPSQYDQKGKIWSIRSAENGLVFMAADRGLLVFDGKNWRSYKGSAGFTRSLCTVGDSLIYTGSDMDFGIWRKNRSNGYAYTSLYPFKEDVQTINEEFWGVHSMEESIIFISSRNLYIYKNGQLTRISAPGKIGGSFTLGQQLYIADERIGLYLFENNDLRLVFRFPDPSGYEISGVYRHSGTLFAVTKNRGVFRGEDGILKPVKNRLSEILKQEKVFSFIPLNDDYLAFGTVLKGLYITDMEGNLVHHINKYKGLMSNTILSLHYAPCGKLWMGLDYGLSVLDLKSRMTYIYDYRGDYGTGYAALLRDETFYLGTNQGLYRSSWEGLNNNAEYYSFQLIPGTEGQVWALEDIDKQLLIGHDRGLFIYRDGKLQQLSTEHGFWNIVPFGDYLLTGNYNGISIFRKSGNTWTFWKKMEQIAGSCNQILIGSDSILWVNIPNFGIIRTRVNNELIPVDRQIFSDTAFYGSNPFLIRDLSGIRLLTDQFQYIYNEQNRRFSPLNDKIVKPTAEGLLPGIYQADTLQENYAFFPVNNGFCLKYLVEKEEDDTVRFKILLVGIEALGNEERISVYSDDLIPYRLNNVRIECIVPNQGQVFYQYRLTQSSEWSAWSPDNVFGFLNLKHGKYQMQVRASVNGRLLPELPVDFRIEAPWYQSWYAYLVYLILLAVVIVVLKYLQTATLKRQKKQMLIREQNALREQAEKHRQEIDRLEQERLQMENDQLKKLLKTKTIDLAGKAKDNEDKNRLLTTLREKCAMAVQNPSDSPKKWADMQRLIDNYLKNEDNSFDIQMNELHQDFFRNLKNRFPGLSGNDLRLCAYLRIGLTSKEIADMLNIQPSSSYISRSRLRKKLQLNPDEDLYDFLSAI